MKLQTLKSRITVDRTSRVQVLQGRAGTVERKRGSAGVKDRRSIRARDCDLCQPCLAIGRATPARIVDHIIPLWEGGSDGDENKQVICIPCHESKSDTEAKRRAGKQ